MQVGIDSFAAAFDENSRALNPADRLRQLVEQIEHAEEVGLDAFGMPLACPEASPVGQAMLDQRHPLAPCFRNVAWTSGFPSAIAMSDMGSPFPGALMSAPP